MYVLQFFKKEIRNVMVMKTRGLFSPQENNIDPHYSYTSYTSPEGIYHIIIQWGQF